MKKIIITIVFLTVLKLSYGQNNYRLAGTWELQYSLKENRDSCNLSKETSTLILQNNGIYSWSNNGDTIRGRWKAIANKIHLYNTKAVNFEGTVSNIIYPIEVINEILIIHQPVGGDILCPHLYFRRKK
jgi:hypothetical protein